MKIENDDEPNPALSTITYLRFPKNKITNDSQPTPKSIYPQPRLFSPVKRITEARETISSGDKFPKYFGRNKSGRP
jgi:hypothetical protein